MATSSRGTPGGAVANAAIEAVIHRAMQARRGHTALASADRTTSYFVQFCMVPVRANSHAGELAGSSLTHPLASGA